MRRAEARAQFLLILAVCLAFQLAGITAPTVLACDQPATYDGFTVVDAADPISLKQEIETECGPGSGCNDKMLFVPPYPNVAPGAGWVVQNPISINCPVFLHGGSQGNTTLIPMNPNAPMFIVGNAGHVQIAGIRFESKKLAPDDLYEPNVVAIKFQNTQDILFEMYDSLLHHSSIAIGGPGTFRIQSLAAVNDAHVNAAILLDHAGASLTVVSGDIHNAPHTSLPHPDTVPGPIYHIWQKRGRLQIYGMTFEDAWGNADVRIERASNQGPHIITAVRSEGAINNATGSPSALLYVPPTTQPVDVLMMQNEGSWAHLGIGTGHLVDYNATGKLWLLGNSSEQGSAHLAVGQAPGATVIALGNRTWGPDILPINVTTGRKITAGNVYSWMDFTGCDAPDSCCFPVARFVNPTETLTTAPGTGIPEAPETSIPPQLTRPSLPLAFAQSIIGMKIVPAPTGDPNQDTNAIQSAFNAALLDGTLMVYFQQGTYKIHDPLLWLHASQAATLNRDCYPTCGSQCPLCTPNCPPPNLCDSSFDVPVLPRGWIAGGGSAGTIIEQTQDESVFLTDGMAYGTIQGLTFKTPSATAANVQLEFLSTNQIGEATQKNAFHDVIFDGGRYAAGIALTSNVQTDMMSFVDCQFRNAAYGLGASGSNSIHNVVYGGQFIGNDITTGQGPNGGANWLLLHTNITGTVDHDLDLNGGGSGWYFHGVTTDSPKIWNSLNDRGANNSLFLDQCSLQPPTGSSPLFETQTGGGLFAIRSQANPNAALKGLRNNSGISVFYAFDLYGQAPLWTDDLPSNPMFAHDLHRTFVLRGGDCSNDQDCNDGLNCTANECDEDHRCVFRSDCAGDDRTCTVDECIRTTAHPEGECVSLPQDLSCEDLSFCTRQTSAISWDNCDPNALGANLNTGCRYQALTTQCCLSCPSQHNCGPFGCDNPPDAECTQTALGSHQCLTAGGTTISCWYPGEPQFPPDLTRDEEVFIRECECTGQPGQFCQNTDRSLPCNCLPGECDDGLFCNGAESCSQVGCAPGTTPCAAGQTCVEFSDLCLPTCPLLTTCGQGNCAETSTCGAPIDTGLAACASTYGMPLACPAGQTIHTKTCNCQKVGGGPPCQAPTYQTWECR